MQIHQLLRQATRQLSGAPRPRLDSEVLLAQVLNTPRSYFYAHPEARVPLSPLREFQNLLARRRQGCPVAYLTGCREFWSLPLRVNAHTLIPRPETEHLVECALRLLPAPRGRGVSEIAGTGPQQGWNRVPEGDRGAGGNSSAPRLLELGTGSGAIAIAIASERPDCDITATDISAEALAVASENARRHTPGRVRFRQGSWFVAVRGGRYDMILSNPPYIAADDPCLADPGIRFEPRQALSDGGDGLQALGHVLRHALGYLARRGWLILEHACDQGGVVRRMLRSEGYADVHTVRDLQGLERVSYAARPAGER